MNNIVESKRIQYTASRFAKESMIFLQETGYSKSIKKHTSSRAYMDSFLFFTVIEGNGTLRYLNEEYQLKSNDCVFIDCRKGYSHTSDNWKIAWVHFNGKNLNSIFNKYLERDGKTVFSSLTNNYLNIINNIYSIADSSSYLKDMNIYNELVNLLNMIMSETIYEDSNKNRKYDLDTIKQYIDSNFLDPISLDQLSSLFYINKFYLTRAFKDRYGTTINNYILEKRITRSKELLRFSDDSIEDISLKCGIKDPNYFSRVFKKIEGITPKEYKKMW